MSSSSTKLIDIYNTKNTKFIQNESSTIIMNDSNRNGLFTTEEEFKKMENAVNNLLFTKTQIDCLNNERNSLMQLYETKLNEQSEQIKYLQEENYFLKQQLLKQNESKQDTNWREKYELCLDNIMRQLLNNLKIQETLRVECMKLEEDTDNNNNNNSERQNSSSSHHISASNSWTFNNFKKTNKVNELLGQQQKQQLNLLNELSDISKKLKMNYQPQNNLNHSFTNSSINNEAIKPENTVKTDSDTSSNILNSSTHSTNSQRSNPRPSRIPKYNRNQKSHHSSNSSTNETKSPRYLSNTKIPQRKVTPQTSAKNLNYQTYTKRKNSMESKPDPRLVNSRTFDKTSNQETITECKEVKLFLNKNLCDILLVPKTTEQKRQKEDEGYSTMSSEIMHRTQTSNRSSAVNTETITSNNTSTIDESLTSSQTSTTYVKNCKKRYCFPTLKTFNYYYNNRYYHQYHKTDSPSFVCCKYLSDTDIQALSNQLNSYDKDVCFNVFHLDTLYNNVDYILFNSYASETELEYNYNRRNGPYNKMLDSNYQLYINDYFNQPYDDDEAKEEEEDETESKSDRNESNFMEYELKDEEDEEEYHLELDYSNQNFVELSVDDTDGLLFDDDDVNLLLDGDVRSNFCLDEYKNMFEKSNLESPLIFSSQSLSSVKTSTCSSSSCDYPLSGDLSLDSISPKNKHEDSEHQEYFIDSIDNYENYDLNNGNQIVFNDQQLIDKFDLDDFVNQLNKQCKVDKLLKSSENTTKKLKELALNEANRVAQNGELSEIRPVGTSLVRRHTITTMPISAACIENKQSELERKIQTSNCHTPCDSPSKYIDTKAYVGSFTNPTNTRTSTPLRRAETVYKKHTYIPPDNELKINYSKSINSVGSTPVKEVKNNFNNDFYRLCSDTFYDGSENNFNNVTESTNSILIKLKQHIAEPEHLDNLQSNVTNHVNNLFDQWLINSKS